MSRPLRSPLTLVVLALLLAAGCGRTEARHRAAAEAREVAALQREKRDLDAARADLAPLRTRLLHAPVKGDGTPAVRDDVALAADVEARQQAIARRSAQLEARLIRLVSGFELRQGQSPPAALRAAIRLKSDEDLAVAREWIERGGDYRRAIDIYQAQLRADPGYPPLKEALARAQAGRFVDPERVAGVAPGMTQPEVRDLLGPVNLRNVVQRPAEHVEAWFYPREKGGNAAVYFRYDAGKRAFLVYRAESEVGGGGAAPRAGGAPAAAPPPKAAAGAP